MRSTQTVLTCNLCRAISKPENLDDLLKSGRWLSFSVDDPVEDRSWQYVDICSSCVLSFKDALKKLNKLQKDPGGPEDT